MGACITIAQYTLRHIKWLPSVTALDRDRDQLALIRSSVLLYHIVRYRNGTSHQIPSSRNPRGKWKGERTRLLFLETGGVFQLTEGRCIVEILVLCVLLTTASGNTRDKCTVCNLCRGTLTL